MTPGFLAAWGPLILSVVTVLAGGGFLKVVFDRTLTKASATKTAVEGEVAQSGDYRAWAEQANQRALAAEKSANEARADADACRRSAWEAQDSAARCRTENVALRERMDDLEELVRGCAAISCPIRPLLPTPISTTPLEGPERPPPAAPPSTTT